MLKQPMIEKLLAMRLHSMAESLKTQEHDPAARELSFLERLGLLVDQQWNWRENQALGRRLKNAKLRTNACVEEIDYRGARGLDNCVIRALVQRSAWVGTHENIFVLGPTVWARASWLAPWHKKPAATGTPHCTPAPKILHRSISTAATDDARSAASAEHWRTPPATRSLAARHLAWLGKRT